MKQVYTTTLRLNLEKEADREAWEHLRRVDRKQYHSVNSAVIAAVNAYFSRKNSWRPTLIWKPGRRRMPFLRKLWKPSRRDCDKLQYPDWFRFSNCCKVRRQEHQHRPRNQRPTQGRTGTRHWTLRGAFDINPYNLR